MDKPSDPEPLNNSFEYITVRDLQAFLRRVGHQRIYRPKEEGDETYDEYAERYMRAVRRFRSINIVDNGSNPESEAGTENES